VLDSGADQRQAMEVAAQLAGEFTPLMDRALLAIYRRQQELAWTEHIVEHIESELEQAGLLGGPNGSPRCASWTWWATPASPRSKAIRPPPSWPRPWPLWSPGPRAHAGVAVKWLGDGVMSWFWEPEAPCWPRFAW
jgi:hypothetical protein